MSSRRVTHPCTYLSDSVAVSFCGFGDNNLLSPVLAIEKLQVFLKSLQPGQLSRKVNGRNTRVVGVPVQFFFQSLVNLVQRAQEELKKKRRCQTLDHTTQRGMTSLNQSISDDFMYG